MQRPNKRKLSLNKEILRELTPFEASKIEGGLTTIPLSLLCPSVLFPCQPPSDGDVDIDDTDVDYNGN